MSLFLRRAGALIFASSIQHIKATQRGNRRWVGPTLRELLHRQRKMGPQKPEPRSGFVEWNLDAEIFAFSKRLNEEFQLPLLKTAFTHTSYITKEQDRQRELGISESNLQMADNTHLAMTGYEVASYFTEAFINYALPKLPTEAKQAIKEHLLSTDTLSHVGMSLGMKELILSDEYPPSNKTFEKTTLAVIGALEESSGFERAFLFVRDFICTQLNQKDLLDIWKPENPVEMLKQICKERDLGELEPRLIGDCGKGTVLSAYQVGMYANKQLIGKGFGEDVNTAIETAALDALQTLFDIHDNRTPINYQVDIRSFMELKRVN